VTDVIVVGAGPAGAVAATILARAGARVRLLERAAFPRHKLCGDTLNPGALAILKRLDLATAVEQQGLRVDGMIVTGENGVTIEGRYPFPHYGRSLPRAALDAALVEGAIAAGVEFEERAPVRQAIFDGGGSRVEGVSIGVNGHRRDLRAAVTIAADGRRSTLAFALGLLAHPRAPRRWAIGAYLHDVPHVSSCGEMHIRPGRYIGVAPLPGGITNVCVVRPVSPSDRPLGDPAELLRTALARDPLLADRFAAARFAARPSVLGPLAVDAQTRVAIPDGLLLAGDAAGFVDPMTGDGLRFALRGAELAAASALRALEHGWTGVQRDLAASRRSELAPKFRFNRTLRRLVGSPAAVRTATIAARVAPGVPGVIRAIMARASDCDLA
jgi:flavin-dependent dehydrogenase